MGLWLNIQCFCRLSKNFGQLHDSDDYTDLSLVVAGRKFHAHKNVLAARSQYFRALLFGGLKESSQREIELKDVNPAAFKDLLKYMYTGTISLLGKTTEGVFHILGLAHLYGFLELEDSILDYFGQILSIRNIYPIYDGALLYRQEHLVSSCLKFMDNHATAILEHESFLQLSSAAVTKLISRDSYEAPGLKIFLAVQSWLKANPESNRDSVLSKVKLNLMTADELLHIVRPTALFSSGAILDAIVERISKGDMISKYSDFKKVVYPVVPDLDVITRAVNFGRMAHMRHCRADDIMERLISRKKLNSIYNIKHIFRLSEDFAQLHNSEDYADLTLIVGGQKFHAHKNVLAARSQYFQALFFGGLKEGSHREFELKDTSPAAFKGLLKYMYTGTISLADKTLEVVFHILGLAHLYDFLELEDSIRDYFCEILRIPNVCSIYDAAFLYRQERLVSSCLKFMDNHATAILEHESFLQLSSAAVTKLISRDSYEAPGLKIFLAVQSWLKTNPESNRDSVLSMVKLNQINITELLNIVRPTELFSDEAILDAIVHITSEDVVILQ